MGNRALRMMAVEIVIRNESEMPLRWLPIVAETIHLTKMESTATAAVTHCTKDVARERQANVYGRAEGRGDEEGAGRGGGGGGSENGTMSPHNMC